MPPVPTAGVLAFTLRTCRLSRPLWPNCHGRSPKPGFQNQKALTTSACRQPTTTKRQRRSPPRTFIVIPRPQIQAKACHPRSPARVQLGVLALPAALDPSNRRTETSCPHGFAEQLPSDAIHTNRSWRYPILQVQLRITASRASFLQIPGSVPERKRPVRNQTCSSIAEHEPHRTNPGAIYPAMAGSRCERRAAAPRRHAWRNAPPERPPNSASTA